MATVAQVVERIIEQKPFIQEALSRGIINNAALAEELMATVEKELKKDVKFSAVNMAIRRLAEKLEKTFVAQARFDRNSDITTRSDLIEITVFKMEDVQQYVRTLYDLVDLRHGDFLTITQGLHELMAITNKKYEQKMLEIFPKKIIKKVIKNLSSLTISIPPESTQSIGLFYIATRALNWENINIIDIVSTLTEMTFLVDEKDTARAFEALRTLIHAQSKD